MKLHELVECQVFSSRAPGRKLVLQVEVHRRWGADVEERLALAKMEEEQQMRRRVQRLSVCAAIAKRGVSFELLRERSTTWRALKL